jgi:hypothetical protein
VRSQISVQLFDYELAQQQGVLDSQAGFVHCSVPASELGLKRCGTAMECREWFRRPWWHEFEHEAVGDEYGRSRLAPK